jgi:hypothetical protein
MIPAHHIHLPISAPSLRIIFSIQPPLPLGFALLLHQQFQFQAFYVGQEAQQGLDFGGGHLLGQVHAGDAGTVGGGGSAGRV